MPCPAATADTAYVVADYGSNSDNHYVAFGECDGTEFCCTFEQASVGEIDTVTVAGTTADDTLAFTWDLGGSDEAFLSSSVSNAVVSCAIGGEPIPSTALLGVINGGDGDDSINGSDAPYEVCAGLSLVDNFLEELNGQDGDDTISGLDGDDELTGGDGADVLIGGDGNDTLDGGGDDDTLCDTTGVVRCSDTATEVLLGGDGNDQLWYDQTVSCPGITLDAVASDAGSGTDDCGDTADYTPPDMPTSCEGGIAAAPAGC